MRGVEGRNEGRKEQEKRKRIQDHRSIRWSLRGGHQCWQRGYRKLWDGKKAAAAPMVLILAQ